MTEVIRPAERHWPYNLTRLSSACYNPLPSRRRHTGQVRCTIMHENRYAKFVVRRVKLEA